MDIVALVVGLLGIVGIVAGNARRKAPERYAKKQHPEPTEKMVRSMRRNGIASMVMGTIVVLISTYALLIAYDILDDKYWL